MSHPCNGGNDWRLPLEKSFSERMFGLVVAPPSCSRAVATQEPIAAIHYLSILTGTRSPEYWPFCHDVSIGGNTSTPVRNHPIFRSR
jgi:hypothetical protein